MCLDGVSAATLRKWAQFRLAAFSVAPATRSSDTTRSLAELNPAKDTMTNAEIDRMLQQAARKIVSVEITPGPGPLPAGIFDQAPRVIATLEDGATLELFSYFANERSFTPAEFVGLTVDEGRRLKFGAIGGAHV